MASKKDAGGKLDILKIETIEEFEAQLENSQSKVWCVHSNMGGGDSFCFNPSHHFLSHSLSISSSSSWTYTKTGAACAMLSTRRFSV